ncbi:S9 family peptidase [SAR202 cluster bacterium AC-647-P02_OGT_505m]|nr:S9 family peptidase [SAR202 cluster bacterium AC-647-P02_OGT_505m]
MAKKNIASYGSWESPISTKMIVSEAVGLGDMDIDGSDIYWLETRPEESGRHVVVRKTSEGLINDVTPLGFSARTSVHEYGGGSYLAYRGTVFFSNYSDQRVYKVKTEEGNPIPITPEGLDIRFANGSVDELRNRIIYVREDHSQTGEAVNTLVALDMDDVAEGIILTEGADFYSSPSVSPDGSSVAWIQWDHPNMPWDSTELWVADISETGMFENKRKLRGSSGESICHPSWSPDNLLYFVSDVSGWWNIHRYQDIQLTKSKNLTPIKAEFTQAQWGLGSRYYGFLSEDRIICAYNTNGKWNLAELDVNTSKLEGIQTAFTEFNRSGLESKNGMTVLGAGSSIKPFSVYLYLDKKVTELKSAIRPKVDETYFSLPESITFPTSEDLNSHGFFYPPHNPDYDQEELNQLPPLLVLSHGGPTGATSTTLDLSIQFWTSRGFGVLDVNYRGSTGYGTTYRKRLNGKWGIVDIDDCVNGALYLAKRGDIDKEKMSIRGGSAGGYTTLAALTFKNVFSAGASYYGVSDLEALAKDTHKFESRYMDSMVGPYPENKAVYRERSPIFHTEKLSCPVILFQGLEDKIVLPNQAEMMVASLKDKKIPVAYLPFEGEQHGFRISKNIQRTLEAELYFYSKVFGFKAAGKIKPVQIDGLN